MYAVVAQEASHITCIHARGWGQGKVSYGVDYYRTRQVASTHNYTRFSPTLSVPRGAGSWRLCGALPPALMLATNQNSDNG